MLGDSPGKIRAAAVKADRELVLFILIQFLDPGSLDKRRYLNHAYPVTEQLALLVYKVLKIASVDTRKSLKNCKTKRMDTGWHSANDLDRLIVQQPDRHNLNKLSALRLIACNNQRTDCPIDFGNRLRLVPDDLQFRFRNDS